jgi:hypothetical protein
MSITMGGLPGLGQEKEMGFVRSEVMCARNRHYRDPYLLGSLGKHHRHPSLDRKRCKAIVAVHRHNGGSLAPNRGIRLTVDFTAPQRANVTGQAKKTVRQ